MIELNGEQRMFRDACAGLAADLAARWQPRPRPVRAASPSPAAPVLGTLTAAGQLRAYGAEPGLLGDIAAAAVRVAPLLGPSLHDFAPAADGALSWDCAGADFAASVQEGAVGRSACRARSLPRAA